MAVVDGGFSDPCGEGAGVVEVVADEVTSGSAGGFSVAAVVDEVEGPAVEEVGCEGEEVGSAAGESVPEDEWRAVFGSDADAEGDGAGVGGGEWEYGFLEHGVIPESWRWRSRASARIRVSMMAAVGGGCKRGGGAGVGVDGIPGGGMMCFDTRAAVLTDGELRFVADGF